MIYAALEATLLAYVKHDHDAVPVLRMMRLSKDEIAARAEALTRLVRSGAKNASNLTLETIDGESVIVEEPLPPRLFRLASSHSLIAN